MVSPQPYFQAHEDQHHEAGSGERLRYGMLSAWNTPQAGSSPSPNTSNFESTLLVLTHSMPECPKMLYKPMGPVHSTTKV